MTERPQAKRRFDERESFVWKGQPRKPLGDAYHAWLDASWRAALAAVFVVYAALNLFFAVLYYAVEGIENARPGSFADAFFFSVQTLATIGYGKMAPISTAANVVVSFEALTGMVGTAMITGLLFAKFARPTARVLFSRVAVITPYQGKPSLQFRVANERGNRIVEAQMRVTALKTEVTQEGVTLRRQVDVTMLRERSAVFALTWTAIHVIDESSPLHGLTAQQMRDKQVLLFASVLGLDETFAQTIHARQAYQPEDVLFDKHFVDIIRELPDGRREIDYTRFHDVA